jgi:hypothetical protein
MHRFLSASLTLALVIAAPLSAQNVTRRPFSLDLALGASNGWGGYYGTGHGLAIEATFAPAHTSAWVTALTAGLRGVPRGENCLIGPGRPPCRLPFPLLAHVGLLGGLEHAISGLTVRGALGPAFFAGDDGKGLGPIARVDLSTGTRHIALVLVGQGELVIRSGETLRRGAIMLGARLR